MGRLIAAAAIISAIMALTMLVTGITASAEDSNPQEAPVTGPSASTGSSPGEIDVAWDAHPEGALDYRVAWAPSGEGFRGAGDTDWNAYPAGASLTITGLEEGAEHKVKVRARFQSNPKSRWSEAVTATAAAEVPPPTPTPTPTPPPTPPPTPTPTPLPTHTPTPTPITETEPLVAEQQQAALTDYAADRYYALGIDIQNNFTRYLTLNDSVDGDANPRDYYEFSLGESVEVNLSLRKLDFDADLFLEDEHGNVLASSENCGTADEDIDATLPDETNYYYIRVEAQEPGLNTYRFKAKVSDPDPATAVTIPEVAGPAVTYIPPPDPEPAAEPQQDGAALRADCLDTNATLCIGTMNRTYSGEIETSGDWDRIRYENLKANKSYVFVMRGKHSGNGTLENVKVSGIYNSFQSGVLQEGTTAQYSAGDSEIQSAYDIEPRVVFTPPTGGRYFVRVGSFSGNGLTNSGTFKLEARRDEELASTNTTATVAVDGSKTGEFEHRRDIDWFKVAVSPDTKYQFDVKGKWTGHGTVWDVNIEGIYDDSGNRVHDGDDNGGLGRNARLEFRTPSGYTSGHLFVGVANNPYTTSPEGTYQVFVTDITNGHPDDIGATIWTASVVSVNGSAEGEIEYQGDRDWFRVELSAGQWYRIEMISHVLRGGGVHAIRTVFDPYIRGIHNSSGDFISGTTDDNTGFYNNAMVEFRPPSTDSYFVAAAGAQSPDGDYREGTYKIEVSTCGPPYCDQ